MFLSLEALCSNARCFSYAQIWFLNRIFTDFSQNKHQKAPKMAFKVLFYCKILKKGGANMAHIHGVVDMDKHFVIDAATREITNQSEKITLMQNDHNSERFTFEIPKEVDGHDMSLCNVVQVHYLNIDATTKAQNPGVYNVEDLQISPDDEATVIGSWLISSAATKYVGNLNFIFRFMCVAEDGSIEYAWSSAIFKGISVGQSYNNADSVAEEYADIFLQWQARIEAFEKARHTHNNQNVLDLIRDISGVLHYNGQSYIAYFEAEGMVDELRLEVKELIGEIEAVIDESEVLNGAY